MDPTAQMTDLAQIRTFVLAGHALFTLVSKRTGERRTFLVEKGEPNERFPKPGYFVRLLTGPDNTNDFSYIGFMWERDGSIGFKPGRNPGAGLEYGSPAVAGFAWFTSALNAPAAAERFLAQAEFWHAGRCGKCGRTLTTPESIAAGIGPVCAGR